MTRLCGARGSLYPLRSVNKVKLVTQSAENWSCMGIWCLSVSQKREGPRQSDIFREVRVSVCYVLPMPPLKKISEKALLVLGAKKNSTTVSKIFNFWKNDYVQLDWTSCADTQKINLQWDQEGYGRFEYTDEKLSARRIHWWCAKNHIFFFWRVILKK